jgi:hypothetical protein
MGRLRDRGVIKIHKGRQKPCNEIPYMSCCGAGTIGNENYKILSNAVVKSNLCFKEVTVILKINCKGTKGGR